MPETFPCCEHCTPSTCADDGDGHLDACVVCQGGTPPVEYSEEANGSW